MVEKRLHRGGRHRVDGVRADQLLDIEHVAVGLVLGAGAGPQQPLGLGPLLGQTLPALIAEDSLIHLISELGVGDRDLALQAFEARFFGGVGRRGDLLVEGLVDHRINAADEKAGDARHFVRVAAFGDVVLQARDVRLGDLAIDLLREQEGDVDVDAFGGHCPDRRQTGLGRRNFDHQIVAPDLAP